VAYTGAWPGKIVEETSAITWSVRQ
jgi:hypothetical protein